MINEPIPQHIFVSYSRADETIVDPIITDLQNKGITIWIDRTGLHTGLPNWNIAIRTALRNSFAVLFMASPDAGQSNTVFGELEVAKDLGCPIYPLWIAGDKWSECAPVEMLYAQRIDCRGNSYDSGLAQVTRDLQELIAHRLPKHCRYTSEYLHSLQEFRLPNSYLLIHLDKPHCVFKQSDSGLVLNPNWSPENTGDIVIMLPKAYQSTRTLLDDMYMEYLSSRYRPYTYGMEWVLAKELSHNPQKQLMVPWEWLEELDNRPPANYHPEWNDTSPDDFGFSPGIELIILNGPIKSAFGVITNDVKVAATLTDHDGAYVKEKYALLDYLVRQRALSLLSPHSLRPFLPRELAHIQIKFVPLKVLDTDKYNYHYVFTPCSFEGGKAAFIIE